MDAFGTSCPHCQALNNVSGKTGYWVICQGCGKLFSKKDSAASTPISKALLKPVDTMSPLQTGTVGKAENQSFKIEGLIQLYFGERYINLWYAAGENRSTIWIADAYGQYALLTENTEADFTKNSFDKITRAVSPMLFRSETHFYLESAQIETIHADGMLPEHTPIGFALMAYFSGVNGGQTLVFLSTENNRALVLSGKNIPFKDWKFDNIRSLHGWTI